MCCYVLLCVAMCSLVMSLCSHDNSSRLTITYNMLIQYTTKSKQTRVLKNFEFKKEVGIDIKSKETSS